MTAKPSSSLRWAGIRMGILYPLLHGLFLQMMSPVHGDSAHIWNILASLILHVNMQDQWGTNSDLTTSGWTNKRLSESSRLGDYDIICAGGVAIASQQPCRVAVFVCTYVRLSMDFYFRTYCMSVSYLYASVRAGQLGELNTASIIDIP